MRHDVRQNLEKFVLNYLTSYHDYYYKQAVDIVSRISWGCRICQQHLCRGVRPQTIWWWGLSPRALGMWSTSSLPLFPGPLWPSDSICVPSISQIELFNHLYLKLFNEWALAYFFKKCYLQTIHLKFGIKSNYLTI